MFDRELDYYGITCAENLITVEDSVVTILKSFKKAEREFMKTKREHEMCLLALECYNQVCQSCNDSGDSYYIRIPQGHWVFNKKRSFLDSGEKQLFDKFLGRYGLMVDQIFVSFGGDHFLVCRQAP